ncbi:MAG: patatin-like phospholipase family protein [Coleofasciculus sp. C3-bin4]|nr:patatin-like phospholipase family protein [Coleofasciculus sp. C3-bin4]
MSLYDKANKKTGPYKLLALDGGGIRGMITLEVLAKIEATLRLALGREESFVLADYFDYIAGTSTGAILATAISLGMSVAEIQDFYRQSREGLDHLGGLDDISPKDVQLMDSVKYMPELERIGKALAKKVKPDHFTRFLQ